ncbi:MAG TPA: lipoprotein [Gammaproteobacteria bacterium]
MNHTLYLRSGLVVLLMAFGIAGCGQKGPLVAPPAPAEEAQPVEVPPADAGTEEIIAEEDNEQH